MKDNNDFFSEYNLSGDLSINNVDYSTDSNDFGEGSQLQFDYGLDNMMPVDEVGTTNYDSTVDSIGTTSLDDGLGTVEYNPHIPDMMDALEAIKIPEITHEVPQEPVKPVVESVPQESVKPVVESVPQEPVKPVVESVPQEPVKPVVQGIPQETQSQVKSQHNRKAEQIKKAMSKPLTNEQCLRLKELYTEFYIINNDPHSARNVGEWQRVFANYPVKEDFSNVRFVDGIVSTLERMEISDNVWTFFEYELFVLAGDSQNWKNLKARVTAAKVNARAAGYNKRNGYGNNNDNEAVRNYTTSAAYMRQQIHMASKRNSEEKKEKEAKGMAGFWIFVVIFIVMVKMMSCSNESDDYDYDYDYDYVGSNRYQYDYDYDEIVIEMPSIPKIEIPEFAMPDMSVSETTLENYRKTYVKEYPYKLDLNKDGNRDYIYYDSETGKYMVSIYNPQDGEYHESGTLADYKEQHPKSSDSFLMRFFVDAGEVESEMESETETETA